MSTWRDLTEEFQRAVVKIKLESGVSARGRKETGLFSGGAARNARLGAYGRLGTGAHLALESALYHTRQAIDEARRTNNRDSQLHFCNIEQMLLVQQQRQRTEVEKRECTEHQPRRAHQLGSVEQRLGETEMLFGVVVELLERHNESLGVIERNVFRIETRVDASERELSDAAPRSYRGQLGSPWYVRAIPRTTPGKARAVLALLIAFNLFLFFCGALG